MMNVTLRRIGLVTLKNAVNAALVTLTPYFTDHSDYNFVTWHGIGHVAELVGGAIAAREAMVWVPRLLAWSQSPTDAAEVTSNAGDR